MERETIKIPYTPRLPEVHAALETHRFAAIVAHRRFGKTVMCVNHLLKMALLCDKPRGRFGYVAPFRDQAKSAAWQYLKHYSAGIPFRNVNESELRIDLPSGAFIRVYGADNPDAIRGSYFDGVILDEVAQMKPEVWSEVVQPMLADRKGWAVFIGTPKGVNLFSEIYYGALEKIRKGDKDWIAFSYPITESSSLPADEVARLKQEMSENAWRQEMLCDFTASSDDNLILMDEVREAMGRSIDMETMRQWPIVIGVDVARFGDDATVFFARQGKHAFMPEVLHHKSNVEIAHLLARYVDDRKPQTVCIDQGQGTGVIDLARELLHGTDVQVVEVPFGSRALDQDSYFNRRAEMWTLMRDWIRDGGKLPKDEGLLAELTTPLYSFDASGRIKLEPKDKIKERLGGKSTDLADALALTFALPARSALSVKWREECGQWPTARKEYDPFRYKQGGKKYDPFSGRGHAF